MDSKNNNLKVIIPLLLSFFVMGMVDVVGLATNYISRDFNLDSLTSSIIPMMVFMWFAIFSIPTSMMMNKMGKKNVVLLSIFLNAVALIIPFVFYNIYSVIFAFGLLGIGNTILQVALNPLIAAIVNKDRLPSTLTFGQFVKAICSFVGPLLASFVAREFGDWKFVFVVFAAVSTLTFLWLYLTSIDEEAGEKAKVTSFMDTFNLLKDKTILMLFVGILLAVGIDVCMNTNSPQLLVQRLGMDIEDATLGASIYFGARTFGAFFGAILLLRVNSFLFLRLSMFLAFVSFLGLMFASSQYAIYGAIVLVGITCANIFSIIFAKAMQHRQDSANEASALMVIGIVGGAIIPPIVGFVAKQTSVSTSFVVLLFFAVYLFFLAQHFSKTESKA